MPGSARRRIPTIGPINEPCQRHRRRGRARIDRDSRRGERENLLAVTQFLARLNYNDPKLFQVLGGRRAMIESPLLKELIAETTQKALIEVLVGRFGPEARSLRPTLRAIEDDKELEKLLNQSGTCPDLEAFKRQLAPGRLKRK
jgi:hypothetical protein